MDDGSRDGTFDRVRSSFPDVRLLRHDATRGFTAAANTGLRTASGSILLLLNSDTEVHPDGFRVLTDAFERDPQLGIAGAQLLNSDGSPQWSGGRVPDCLWLFAEASGVVRQLARLPGYRRMRPLARATDRDVAWVSGAALAMRRSVWQRLGPLDESFRLYGQDLDFCTRAGDAPWKIRVLSGFAVLHHQGRDGQRSRERPSSCRVPCGRTFFRWSARDARRGMRRARPVTDLGSGAPVCSDRTGRGRRPPDPAGPTRVGICSVAPGLRDLFSRDLIQSSSCARSRCAIGGPPSDFSGRCCTR